MQWPAQGHRASLNPRSSDIKSKAPANMLHCVDARLGIQGEDQHLCLDTRVDSKFRNHTRASRAAGGWQQDGKRDRKECDCWARSMSGNWCWRNHREYSQWETSTPEGIPSSSPVGKAGQGSLLAHYAHSTAVKPLQGEPSSKKMEAVPSSVQCPQVSLLKDSHCPPPRPLSVYFWASPSPAGTSVPASRATKRFWGHQPKLNLPFAKSWAITISALYFQLCLIKHHSMSTDTFFLMCFICLNFVWPPRVWFSRAVITSHGFFGMTSRRLIQNIVLCSESIYTNFQRKGHSQAELPLWGIWGPSLLYFLKGPV